MIDKLLDLRNRLFHHQRNALILMVDISQQFEGIHLFETIIIRRLLGHILVFTHFFVLIKINPKKVKPPFTAILMKPISKS